MDNNNTRLWVSLGIIVVLIVGVWMYSSTGDSGSYTATTTERGATTTVATTTNPLHAWEEFKLRQECVVKENLAPSTTVIVFSKEGATSTAEGKDVFDCNGFLLVYE